MLERKLEIGLVVACMLLGACGSDDPQLARKGGPIPTPPDDSMTAGGQNGNAGSGNDEPVPWCKALKVLEANCQRCHLDPPKNGAPIPLMTYEDTQGPWSATQLVHDVMLDAVERGFMPYLALNDPPTSLMPPVEPMPAADKLALVAWLNQGAKPVGGTDCP
jgi:hypothetical protein